MASVSFQAITAAAFATLAGTPANLTAGRIYVITDATTGITRMARVYNNGTSNVVENVLKDAVATPIGFDGVSLSWKNALLEDKTLDIAGTLKVDKGAGEIITSYGSPLEQITRPIQKSDTIAMAFARVSNSFDSFGQNLADHKSSKSDHAAATTTDNGFMSSTDKSKLNGIAANANNYSHPTTDGNKHVPANGTTNSGKVLKASATAGTYTWEAVTATDVGLGNVNNTSDANKPISTATQTALDLKAPLASPAFSGTPTAPTASAATNTTQIATTAFVQTVVGNAISSVFKYMGSATAAAIAANNTAIAGHAYRVGAAGNIASAEGDTYAEVGDLAICIASSPRKWTIVQNNINLDGLVYEVDDDFIDVEFNSALSRYTIGHYDRGFTLGTGTAATLSFGGTFTTLVDTDLSVSKGHLTGIKKKTFTLPSLPNVVSRVLTSYTKGAAATAIAATDTLGAALGKLECRLDVIDTLLTWQ